MSDYLRIQPAQPKDYQAVADLLNAAYRQVGARPNETAHTVRERAQDALVIVVDLLGIPVGTLTVAPAGSFHGRNAKKGQMQVSRLAVHPDHQGRGIAKKMLRTVIALCREHGVQALIGASLDTMAPAHQLYKSIGATPTPLPGIKAQVFTLDLTTNQKEN